MQKIICFTIIIDPSLRADRNNIKTVSINFEVCCGECRGFAESSTSNSNAFRHGNG